MPFYYNAADSKNSSRDFIAVTVYTNKYIIKGEISTRAGIRLTDHINSETTSKFIALRNVQIHIQGAEKPFDECEFMNINLDNILFLYPNKQK